MGTGIGVTVAGLALSGDQAADYVLTQPTTTANINRPRSPSRASRPSIRDYDGTTAVQLDTSAAVLNGVIGTDDVTLETSDAKGELDSADVGNGIGVTIAGLTLGGAQASDYALTPPTTTANINPAPLTVTGITAANKVYDGTTDAALDASGAALVGVIAGDDVTLDAADATGTFASPDVGNGIAVTIAGLTIGGCAGVRLRADPAHHHGRYHRGDHDDHDDHHIQRQSRRPPANP